MYRDTPELSDKGLLLFFFEHLDLSAITVALDLIEAKGLEKR